MATKRSRSDNFTLEQISFITQRVRENIKVILNRGCTTEHHRMRDNAWKAIADQMNLLHPENKKNYTQLKRWLKNKKQRCRKEMKAYQNNCRAAASRIVEGVQRDPPDPPPEDIQEFWIMVRGPDDTLSLDSGSDNEGQQPSLWEQEDEPRPMDEACEPALKAIKVESAWSLETEDAARGSTFQQPLFPTPQPVTPYFACSTSTSSTPAPQPPQLRVFEPTITARQQSQVSSSMTSSQLSQMPSTITSSQQSQMPSTITSSQQSQMPSTITSSQQSQMPSTIASPHQHQGPFINPSRQQNQVPVPPVQSQVAPTMPYSNGKSTVGQNETRNSQVIYPQPEKRNASEERSQEREVLEHTLRVQRLKLEISNEKLRNKMLKFKWAKMMTKELNAEISDDSD